MDEKELEELVDDKMCPYCGHEKATEEHHLIKRGERPELIKDKRNLIKLCGDCHRRTENSNSFYRKIQRIFLTQAFIEEVKYKV